MRVTYSGPDRLSPTRTVTTGPAGDYRFPGVPFGTFPLVAEDPVLHLFGRVEGEVSISNSPLRVDLPLAGLGIVELVVLEADGVRPATNATVTVRTDPVTTADTDEAGRVTVRQVRMGQVQVTAVSNRSGERSRAARTNLVLSVPGQVQSAVMRLSGVARLRAGGRGFADPGHAARRPGERRVVHAFGAGR